MIAQATEQEFKKGSTAGYKIRVTNHYHEKLLGFKMQSTILFVHRVAIYCLVQYRRKIAHLLSISNSLDGDMIFI
jgi:hypothetical protein